VGGGKIRKGGRAEEGICRGRGREFGGTRNARRKGRAAAEGGGA
jgi:hypothetical protein